MFFWESPPRFVDNKDVLFLDFLSLGASFYLVSFETYDDNTPSDAGSLDPLLLILFNVISAAYTALAFSN